MVIRHIGVGSLAKMLAALYAFWGFIFGVIRGASLAMVGAGIGAATATMPMAGGRAGCSALARSSFCRFCYGVFGAIGGALTAVMYNVVAGMVGGLSIETE